MRGLVVFFFLYGALSVWAQVTSFLQVDIQNDFLNYRGHGTDRYYTAGNSFAYVRQQPRHLFSYHVFSITQQLFTPSDLQDTLLSAIDYPYAGLLYLSYRTLVYGPKKKGMYSAQVAVGYTGKRSGAPLTQRWLHRLIRDEMPRGWGRMLELGWYWQNEFLFYKPVWQPRWGGVGLYQQASWGTIFGRLQWGICLFRGKVTQAVTSFQLAGADDASLQGSKKFNAFITPTVTWVIRNRLLTAVVDPVDSFSRHVYGRLSGVAFGVGYRCKAGSIYFTQQLQTREFEQAQPHAWGELLCLIPLSHKSQ